MQHHPCLYTLASTPLPLHPCLYTLASTPLPLHPCLYTLALQHLSVPDLDVIGYTCLNCSRIEAESRNGVRPAASARRV